MGTFNYSSTYKLKTITFSVISDQFLVKNIATLQNYVLDTDPYQIVLREYLIRLGIEKNINKCIKRTNIERILINYLQMFYLKAKDFGFEIVMSLI